MNDMVKYKGYIGSVHYSDEDQVFFGKLEYIKSLVNYEGTDVKSLKQSFEEAVDDYLDLCRQEGIEPEQPCKGSFNVRAGNEPHREETTTGIISARKANKLEEKEYWRKRK